MPGAKGGWITMRDAVKKALHKDVPKPGKFRLPGSDDKSEPAEGKPAEQGGA